MVGFMLRRPKGHAEPHGHGSLKATPPDDAPKNEPNVPEDFKDFTWPPSDEEPSPFHRVDGDASRLEPARLCPSPAAPSAATRVLMDSPERVESERAVETTGPALNNLAPAGRRGRERAAAPATRQMGEARNETRQSIGPLRLLVIAGGVLAVALSVGLVVHHLVVDLMAGHAIEALVGDPAFQSLSPRVQLMFKDIRPRVLPGLVRERYAAAKTAFDNQQYDTATDQFKQVLALLSDLDLAHGNADSSLADLRTLATGFVDLATAAGAQRPATAAGVQGPETPADASSAASDSGALGGKRAKRLVKGTPNSHTSGQR